jgi:hypothetical protein
MHDRQIILETAAYNAAVSMKKSEVTPIRLGDYVPIVLRSSCLVVGGLGVLSAGWWLAAFTGTLMGHV